VDCGGNLNWSGWGRKIGAQNRGLLYQIVNTTALLALDSEKHPRLQLREWRIWGSKRRKRPSLPREERRVPGRSLPVPSRVGRPSSWWPTVRPRSSMDGSLTSDNMGSDVAKMPRCLASSNQIAYLSPTVLWFVPTLIFHGLLWASSVIFRI
jgi:hypothetical protein